MTDFNSADPALGILAWLLTYLLHSTILIGGIWCVLRLRLVRSAGTEDILWKIGLVGALLTATLQTSAGIQPVSGTYALGSPALSASPLQASGRAIEGTAAPVIEADIALGLLAVDGGPDIRFAFREVPAPRIRRMDVTPFVVRDTAPLGTPREQSGSGLGHLMGPTSRAADPALVTLGSLESGLTDDLFVAPAMLASGGLESSPMQAAPPSDARSAGVAELSGLAWLSGQWMPIAAGLWVLLAGVGLCRFLALRHRLLRALGTRKPVTSIRMLSILGRLEHRAGITGAVRLTSSPFLSGPVALGRREICVPTRAVSDLEPQQQEALLAHELAHIRRRDPQWLNVCAVVEALFFFQPLNRLARTRLQAVSEFLCDDWAVDSTGRRVTLAQCLAEVATWIEDTRDVLPVAGMARPDSSLVQRIRRIADRPPRQKALRRSASALLALALLGVVSCGVPGISSGRPGGSLLEQLEQLVQNAFRALSPSAAQTLSTPSNAVRGPAQEAPQDAPCPPADACEDEAAPCAPAPDSCPDGVVEGGAPPAPDPVRVADRPSVFQRRLARPNAASPAPAPAPKAWPAPAPGRAPRAWPARLSAPSPTPAPDPAPAPSPQPGALVWPSAPGAPSPAPVRVPAQDPRTWPTHVRPVPAASPSRPARSLPPGRNASRKAPVFVRTVTPPRTLTEPLARFLHTVPAPAQPGAPLASLRVNGSQVELLQGDGDDDGTIVLRVVDGEVVGVDSTGRTFRIVGVDRPGGSNTTRLEFEDSQLRVVDGEGETIVVLTLTEEGDGGQEVGVRARSGRATVIRAPRIDFGDGPDREEMEREIDRELHDIEHEYQSQMEDLQRVMSGLQREFDLAQRDLSREFEDATKQGQREYDSAMKDWTREYENGSEEMSRVYEEVIDELQRELDDIQREWADDPDALEEMVEEWLDRQSDWEDQFEDDWDDWEHSIEEELEGLEDEYESWWEAVEDDFDRAFEDLESEYESGMEDWESGLDSLEDEYEQAFDELELLMDGFAMSWSDGRDCDHDCENECSNGCTHPEDGDAGDAWSDCDEAQDCEDQADDSELLVEAGVN